MAKKSKFEIVINGSTKGFTSSLYRAQSAVRGFNKELDSSQRMARQMDRGLTSMAGKFSTLFGGLSMGLFAKSVWDSSVAMESLEKSFKAITGSTGAAGKELDYVRSVADELGLVFDKTARDYKNLSAAAKDTALEGAGTRDIFRAIAEASAALGMSADDTTGSLRAISQMMSKGSVQAEELRGQLGERLPGAFPLAARAMGVTTQELNKMLEAGDVLATDMLPKLAAVLHDKFGQAAIDAADSDQAALNRFKTAWFDLKVTVGKAGFMDLATGKITDLATAMNDPAVQEKIVKLAENFFALAEAVFNFAAKYGELIVKVGGGVVALALLNRTILTLTGVWRGLNTAMITMTGIRLIPWLSIAATGITSVTVAAGGLSAALGLAAGAFLALAAGYKAGEWLTMHKHWEAIAESTKNLETYSGRVEAKFRKISQATGVVVTSMDELDQAVDDGKIHYDDLTNTWVKGAAEMAAATQKAAAVQQESTVEVTAEMKAAWRKYADEVKRLQDQIAGREQSLAEQLRSMGRGGMSDLGAWKDRKAEALEYERAAKEAAKAGDFKEAVVWADKAKAAYADLNKEVKISTRELIAQKQAQARSMKDSGWRTGSYTKYLALQKEIKQLQADMAKEGADSQKTAISGQEALKTSMDGVKAAGDIATEALKAQEEAAKKAADALNEESGFQLGEAFTKAGEEAKALAELAGDFEDDWRTAFVKMGQEAAEQIDAIDRNLDEMARDRDVTLRIHEVQAKAGGGQAYAAGGRAQHLAIGGRVTGPGGIDKVNAWLTKDEVVIKEPSVRAAGLKAALAFNAGNWPVVIQELLRRFSIKMYSGGLVNNLRLPELPKFATGGPAGAGAGGETVNINLSLPGGSGPVALQASRSSADQLLRDVARMQRLRS